MNLFPAVFLLNTEKRLTVCHFGAPARAPAAGISQEDRLGRRVCILRLVHRK